MNSFGLDETEFLDEVLYSEKLQRMSLDDDVFLADPDPVDVFLNDCDTGSKQSSPFPVQEQCSTGIKRSFTSPVSLAQLGQVVTPAVVLNGPPQTVPQYAFNSITSIPSHPHRNNSLPSIALNFEVPSGLRRIRSSPTDLSMLCSQNPDASDLLKQRRLARKAEAARLSRRRKKAYIEALEEKVTKLTARLAELEAQSAASNSLNVVQKSESSPQSIWNQLETLLNEPAGHEDRIRELMNQYIKGSKRKHSTVDFYLGRVDACLVPLSQVKFALWGFSSTENFSNPTGVWISILRQEIGLSDQQIAELGSLVDDGLLARTSLQNLHIQLKKLRDAVKSHLQLRDLHVDNLHQVLSPIQAAKFCVWVDKNPLCIQMLNTVWKSS